MQSFVFSCSSPVDLIAKEAFVNSLALQCWRPSSSPWIYSAGGLHHLLSFTVEEVFLAIVNDLLMQSLAVLWSINDVTNSRINIPKMGAMSSPSQVHLRVIVGAVSIFSLVFNLIGLHHLSLLHPLGCLDNKRGLPHPLVVSTIKEVFLANIVDVL
uniref:Uncharacterized protein n=1 Tax=Cannabis sativa TaxID=3483 RepID=A0A803PEV5_CANSA